MLCPPLWSHYLLDGWDNQRRIILVPSHSRVSVSLNDAPNLQLASHFAGPGSRVVHIVETYGMVEDERSTEGKYDGKQVLDPESVKEAKNDKDEFRRVGPTIVFDADSKGLTGTDSAAAYEFGGVGLDASQGNFMGIGAFRLIFYVALDCQVVRVHLLPHSLTQEPYCQC